MEEIQTIPYVARGDLASVYERSNLTRLQFLYWMGHRLRPSSPLFNTILAFTISGDVDREHFQRAFQALIEHSDALRTVIEEVEGVPIRRVPPDFRCSLEYQDFSTESYPITALYQWMRHRSTIPLDIEVCLFDSALLKTAPNRFVWYLNQDHMITDASSAILVFERLAQLYDLSLNREPLRLSGLPSFENYIEYERKYSGSPSAARSEFFWKQKLIPGPDPIHFYGRQPNKKSTRVQRISSDMGTERSQKLKAIAKRKDIFMINEDISTYNIFAALFFLQLYRLSGNRRLGFVTPVHNRISAELKNTVGLLLELCPFQVEISDGETFLSLIKKVKRETQTTMAHYQYGSGLSLQQGSFDVMFNIYQMPDLELSDMPVRVERIHPGHGSESLALHVNNLGASGSYLLNFDFHDDVFSEEERNTTVQDFLQLVDTFLNNGPDCVVDIAPITVRQRTQLPPGHKQHKSVDASRPGSRTPQDILEGQLIRIWEEILDVSPIGVNDDFFDLGGNSWMAVRLFVQVEKLTGQYLPLTTLLDTATVSELAGVIRREMGKNLWSTLITVQPGNGKNPLYMVPGAGGNGLTVARIAEHLGPDQPVHMFQIPLGEADEIAPFTTIEDMAAHYVEALQKVQAEGPYLLGGYSAGGLVAFEVAQQLVEQGQTVGFLTIIDVAAQSSNFKYVRQLTRGFARLSGIKSEKELDIYLYLRDMLFRLNYFMKLGYRDLIHRYASYVRGQGGRLKRFLGLEREEKQDRIRRKLRAMNISAFNTEPNNLNHSNLVEDGDLAWASEDHYMRRYFEINNIAVKCYIPKRFPGRITLFRSADGYRYPEQRSPYPDLGWARVASDGLEVYEIPGNHLQMVREPNVKLLGERLRICLERAQGIEHSSTEETSRGF